MTVRDENSTLIALSELWNLEADRVAKIEDERQARQEAERRARQEAERRARREAERRAREVAEKIAKTNAEREQEEREARLRLQEVELRTRAEQEARLRVEQMRLDAQIKITEKKKAGPLWLAVTPIILGISLVVGGYAAWDTIESRDRSAQAEREQAAERDEEHRKVLAALTAHFAELKAEQDHLESQRAELDRKIKEVKDESKRRLLLAEKTALDDQLDHNARKRRDNRGKPRSQATTKTAETKKPTLKISESDDPLAGLE